MKFSCKDITELTSAYVDGKLSFIDRIHYRLHLFVCHNCRVYLDQFKAMLASFGKSRREPEAKQVDDLVARMMQERQSKDS